MTDLKSLFIHNHDFLSDNIKKVSNESKCRMIKICNKGKMIGKAKLYPFIEESLKLAKPVFKSINADMIVKNVMNRKYIRIDDKDEKRYNIDYKIKTGDELEDLVSLYARSEVEHHNLIEKIKKYNKIDEKVIVGDEITILNVPASKLEEFGYTVDYNKLLPINEINDRIDFLDSIKGDISRLDDSENYLARVNRVENYCQETLKENKNDFEDEIIEENPTDEINLVKEDSLTHIYTETEDIIIETLRDLCEEALKFGYNFNDTRKPILMNDKKGSKSLHR